VTARSLPALALLAALAAAPAGAAAQQPVNPIHPLFAPLDAEGRPAARPEDVSADRTCGGCHDARYVAAHSGHARAGAKATCIECHADGGRLPIGRLEGGKLRRDDVRIGRPRTASCAACHGVVSDGAAPVLVPEGIEAAAPAGGRTFSLTLAEGAVVSPQRMKDSFLDLEGKADLAQPWDVHAAKLVDCVACHYAPNDPSRADGKHARLRYVAADPRRASVAEFLVRPDHRLAEPDCRTCHAPLETHRFLPYRERHMEVLACAACHVPGPMGPAAEMVDATVATPAGTPAFRWRNVDRAEGASLNASPVHPLRPLLVLRTEADGARRLTPVNVVSRWRWVSGADGAEVPFEKVASAFLEGERYAPAVLETFDANRDGQVDRAELRLDAPRKTALVANRLRTLGVVDPRIDGELEPHALAHGVAGRDHALRDCEACHAADSRLSGTYAIAAYLPGGVPPRPPDGGRVDLAGALVPSADGGLDFHRAPDAAPGELHVLGHSRQSLTNTLGFAIFLAVLAGVALHGGARVVLRRRAGATARRAPHGEQEYVFGRYERIWHWIMAASGIALMLTGLVVHAPGGGWPLSLPTAVWLHNAAAVVLMVNAGLSLFHHLVTRAIRHFIPHPHGLLERALDHLQYQSRGIFQGDPHPHHPGHKLNPLQQVTYLGLLAVLFPLQIATGLVIWAVGHWPAFGAAAGGLHLVAPLHNLGAWLFLAFFVLHGYLVTTGDTVGDHLRSMVTGYRTVPGASDPQGA
jgi:thiosulfate reductase cytochrome b subunit